MFKITSEWLIKILLPIGAVALIIGALTGSEKALIAFAIFLVMLYGAWAVADPESAFMDRYEGLFERLEPSDMALLLTKVVGITIMIASAIALIVLLIR